MKFTLIIGTLAIFGLVSFACGSGGGSGGPGIDVSGGSDAVEDGGAEDGALPDGGGEPDEICAPDCAGKVCGGDGCGGVCGDCGAGELCQLGLCVPEGSCEILADCLPRICGEDGECADCTDDLQCADADLVCNEDSGHCVDCVEDADCPEGAACNENYTCQALACPDVDCPEGLVCDEEAHACVECVTAADCGPWDECLDNVCIGPAPCESSKDCADDEVCWKEEGICVFCVEDADCDDGYRCTAEHLCEEILYCDSDKDCKDYDKVCDKDLGECVDCLSDVDCALDHFCMDADCLPDLCDQGAEGPVCLGGDVVACNENGSVVIPVALCLEGTFCLDAACVEWLCVPGAAGCDGDVAFVCNDEGSGHASEEICEGQDISCVMGECIEVVCQPGETVCLNPQAMVTCDEEGATFEVTECGDGAYCDDAIGACLEWVCVPDSQWCQGNSVMACDGIGSEAAKVDDCTEDELTCVDGACIACVSDCTDLECGDDGCGGSCGLCEEGFACVWDGQCSPLPCNDGCTGATPAAIFCGLELCTPGVALGVTVGSPVGDNPASGVSVIEHYGSAQNDLVVMGGTSYLGVATGQLVGGDHNGQLPGGTSWDDPWATTNGNDVVHVRLSLRAPPGVSGFCVDSYFLSREYNVQQQQFNDKFYLVVTAPGGPVAAGAVINFMPCPDPGAFTSFTDADGTAMCYVTVKSGFHTCSEGSPNLDATGFTCGYGWMRTCWPVAGAALFDLVIHIHDEQDAAYDSVALVDNFQWTYGDLQQGTWFIE
ncbi:MAG: hypothetical protein ABIK09_11005 [Pseudomonadota bacterium]